MFSPRHDAAGEVPITCVAGVEHEGRVWLGGDSAASESYGGTLTIRAEPKVWSAGEFVYGYAASFRFGELVKHVFKPPKLPRSGLERYMVRDFIPALRETFRADMELQGEEKHPPVAILIGVRGKLFEMYGADFQVGRPREGYAAIGSGCEVALGVLFATTHERPRDRLRIALLASEAHNAFVRRPFAYVETPERPDGRRRR